MESNIRYEHSSASETRKVLSTDHMLIDRLDHHLLSSTKSISPNSAAGYSLASHSYPEYCRTLVVTGDK